MNIFFTVEPTSSNDAEEACKLLLSKLLQKDPNFVLGSRNESIKKNLSEEKVEVSDLKNLISSLGKSTSLEYNGSVKTFPKPSCGKFSEKSSDTDSDGEQSHKHILRKKN